MQQKEKEPSLLTREIKQFKIDLLQKGKGNASLIPLLQSAQDSYGYVPGQAIHYISKIVGIPASVIYGVITFYSQFRLTPLGKYVIKICQGTACHVNGANKILYAIQNELGISVDETDSSGLFTLQSVACLGCCSLSPVVMINDTTYGSLTPDKIRKILKKYRKNDELR
jgi:NADH-quinone oxidoreductase subunit E